MPLTWSNKWIQSYESYWCTINKLKYANAINGGELLSIINLSTRYADHSTSCYNTLIQKLEHIGVRSYEHHMYFLNNLLGKLYENDTLDKYMNPFLIYCPDCLRMGYHSWLHQSIFIDSCPIHNIALESVCPYCHQSINLDINSTKSIPAFNCLCGYNFLQNENYRNMLSNWIKSINLSDSITYISKLLTNSLTTYYYSYNSKYGYQSLQNLSLNFSSLTSNNLLDIAHFKTIQFYFDTTKSNMESQLLSPLSQQQKLFFLIELYINAIKCLSKMLRRKYANINKAIRLYRNYRNSQFYSLIKGDLKMSSENIAAYTYLMWRRDVEGHDTFETVHTNLKLGSHSISFTGLHESILKSKLFQYFWSQLEEVNATSPDQHKLELFYLTMNCLIYDMLLSYFKNWYNHACRKFHHFNYITAEDLYTSIGYELPFYFSYTSNDYALIISKVNVLYQNKEGLLPHDINYST